MKVTDALALGCTVFLVLAVSCSERPPGQEKPIARVNEYVITEGVFRRDLSASARYHNILGLTRADKREFLNGLIKKELLIQEAISRNLDKEDEFRQAIERYWEQVLITSLLKSEGVRLEKEVVVTREDLEEHYRSMIQKDASLPPLEEMLPELEKQVREINKTKAMDAWMNALSKGAKITVYDENLEALK